MKIKQILTEIGSRILYPKIQVGWAGGKAYFTIDGIEYEVKIKLGYDYDVAPGIVRFVDISFAFNEKGKEEYKSTNQNVPLKVMSYVIGAVDKTPNELFKRSKEITQIWFNSIIFSTTDERRSQLYTRLLESYSRTRDAAVSVKKVASDGTFRATFEPYLKFVKGE